MPLLIITGTPCSGKTFRAQQILEDFTTRSEDSQTEPKRSVIHLPSYHASLDPSSIDVSSNSPPDQSVNPRDLVYLAAKQEKTARAEEFSAIKRALGKNTIVIADAPNYIKGFRYQLFCEAKAVGTTSVVLHTAAREDESVKWNNARLEAWNWPIEPEEDAIQDGGSVQVTGPKIGSNVFGELDPESHTAIYGDNVVNNGTKSRSSSTGAAVSDDDPDVSQASQQKADDTMTLKSLYITDRLNNDNSERPPSQQNIADFHTVQEQPQTLPSSTPPSPRSSLPYSSATLKSLHMRYEPPSPFTRWDTPLFTVPSTDPHPPYSQIWSALFPTSTRPPSKKTLAKQQAQTQTQVAASSLTPSNQIQSQQQPTTTSTTSTVRPNAATILPTSHPANALQLLESTTNDIVKLILSTSRTLQITDGTGGTVTFSISINTGDEPEEFTIEVPEGLVLSQPMLQRARRKYTQLQRGGIAHGQGFVAGGDGKRGVVEGFLRFLEGEWGVES